MEKDILNYLPTVMFLETPCIKSDKIAVPKLVLKIKIRESTRSQNRTAVKSNKFDIKLLLSSLL